MSDAPILPYGVLGPTPPADVTVYGAVGDGQSHPAGTWLGLTSLGALRTFWGGRYSFATSLTQEMDFLGFQAAINATTNLGVQRVAVPAGTYIADMTALDYGKRDIIWDEEPGVVYSTMVPATTRTTLDTLPPLLFEQSLDPSIHLKQMSCRVSSSGSGALLGTVTVAAGAVTAIAVTLGGASYIAPRLIITGGGSGATGTVTVVGGAVTGIVITAGGTGYTTGQVNAYVVEGPVVVLMGDSISGEQPSGTGPHENLWNCLQQTLTMQNPRTNFTFFNRAVGAQTWTSANSAPSALWPTWYYNTTRPWLDYVEDLQPDVVIFAFGMNDAQNFVPVQMAAVITDTIAFATRPDVIICTNLVPSAKSTTDSISSDDSQIGRDFVAGYQRGYAEANAYGLIDFHRQCRLVRDGFDVRQSQVRWLATETAATMPWTSTTSVSDFTASLTLNAIPAGYWTGRVLRMSISPHGENVEMFVTIEDDAGYIRVKVLEEYFDGLSSTTQRSVLSTVATPTTGSPVIAITIQDQRLLVEVNTAVAFDDVIARCGGTFAPRFYSATGSETATVTVSLGAGSYVQYQPRLNDYQLWGYAGTTGYLGNALNHPTSIAVRHITAPVVANSNWRRATALRGSATVATNNLVGINEPEPVAKLHVTKTGHSATLTPATTANVALFEDATASGISVLTGTTGTSRILLGYPTSSNAFQILANFSGSPVYSINTAAGTEMQWSDAGGATFGAPTGGVDGLGTINLAGSSGRYIRFNGGPAIYVGAGSPNSAVSAQIGSVYLNTTGGASTTIYIKESGAGTNTGWVAK